MPNFTVITTINRKTEAVRVLEEFSEWRTVLVGDRKSPDIAPTASCEFLSLAAQGRLGFRFFEFCPENHYARKNLGYLYVIGKGADCIYDTDDDNFPNDRWGPLPFACNREVGDGSRFINIYRYFSEENLWPRGYPLQEINKATSAPVVKGVEAADIGVWQAMADGEPDVDAIYRLTVGKNIKFNQNPPVFLPQGSYCPFNSQATFWRLQAFPCLYLPATVSFRFTDILRGYVAQRLLWAEGLHVGFTAAMVYQRRNAHDLMKDFADEVSCYLLAAETVRILDDLHLGAGMAANMLAAYEALAENGIVQRTEIEMLVAWLHDLQTQFNAAQRIGVR